MEAPRAGGSDFTGRSLARYLENQQERWDITAPRPDAQCRISRLAVCLAVARQPRWLDSPGRLRHGGQTRRGGYALGAVSLRALRRPSRVTSKRVKSSGSPGVLVSP